jgi:hypothetical protein
MELQYVPVALPFFLLFFLGLFIFLVILIQLHVLHFAYAKLGLSSGAALLVLLASLICRSGLAKLSNFSAYVISCRS